MKTQSETPKVHVKTDSDLLPFENIFFASSPSRWRHETRGSDETVEAREGGVRIRITKSEGNIYSACFLGASRFDVSHEVIGSNAENFFKKIVSSKAHVSSLDENPSQSEAFKHFLDILKFKNPTDWKQRATITSEKGITREFIGYSSGTRAVIGKYPSGDFFGHIVRGTRDCTEHMLSSEEAKMLYENIKHAGRAWLEVESKFLIHSGMIDKIIAASNKNDWGISHRWSSPENGEKIGALATLNGTYSDGRNELLFTLTIETDTDPSKTGIVLELERNGHRSRINLSKKSSEYGEMVLGYMNSFCDINSLKRYHEREKVIA